MLCVHPQRTFLKKEYFATLDARHSTSWAGDVYFISKNRQTQSHRSSSLLLLLSFCIWSETRERNYKNIVRGRVIVPKVQEAQLSRDWRSWSFIRAALIARHFFMSPIAKRFLNSLASWFFVELMSSVILKISVVIFPRLISGLLSSRFVACRTLLQLNACNTAAATNKHKIENFIVLWESFHSNPRRRNDSNPRPRED